MAKGDGQQQGQGQPGQGGFGGGNLSPLMQRMGGFQGGGSNMLGNAQQMNGGTNPYGPTGGFPGMMGAIQGGANMAGRFAGMQKQPMPQGGMGGGGGMGRFGQAMGQFGGQMGQGQASGGGYNFDPQGTKFAPPRQLDPWSANENRGMGGGGQGGGFGPSPDMQQLMGRMQTGNTGFSGFGGGQGRPYF